MYFTLDEQINDLLNRIGFKLQLNDSRRERAERSYNSLCEWIERDEVYFNKYNLDFYAQGSYRTKTTVKPFAKEEFDLDFVMEVDGKWSNEDPLIILEHLKRRLKENNIYKDNIEVKRRCVRVNYANEFHIDILPAFPEDIYSLDEKIRVPDRKIKDWTCSNPKGYSKWFDRCCNKINRELYEKRVVASVEPIPETEPYEYIEPLRRAVQLIKRFRDVYYKDKSIDAPKSIIITTLSGMHYNGESSEYEAILNILKGIYLSINNSNGRHIEIFNPMNTEEELSEVWKEKNALYKDFCNFINYFYNRWLSLMKLESFEEKALILQELFGETISKSVITEQAQYINKVRQKGNLGVDKNNGILMPINEKTKQNLRVVPKNTFYGE